MNKSIIGIYAIQNKLNSKLYIGSSKNIVKRWQKEHLPALKKGTHYNKHLQAAWNKYGQHNFEFIVVAECTESELAEKEGYWIEYYKSWHRESGYNLVRWVDGRIVRYDHEVCDQVIKLYIEGMSKNQIAKQLSVSRGTVYDHLERSGLHKNEGKGLIIKLTPEMKQDIAERRKQGQTWENILQATGVSKTQVYRAGVANDDQYGGNINRGAYRTVTPETLKRVKMLRKQGKTCEQIEEEVGVSRFALHQHGVRFERLLGLKRQKMTEEKKSEVAKLISGGMSIKEASELTGIPKSTIRKYK